MGDKSKPCKMVLIAQIIFRVLAIVATLVAAYLMMTNYQKTVVFGTEMDARYSYSPTFKFFAYANVIACASSVLALFIAIILWVKGSNPCGFFVIFVHDLVTLLLLMAACAAATAIGYVGKYGDTHTGWMEICGFFPKFCNRGQISTTLSYVGTLLYFIITILSARLAN